VGGLIQAETKTWASVWPTIDFEIGFETALPDKKNQIRQI
jgi:hypothetical protein